MIADLLTVMMKEWREYFAPGGSRRGGLIGILVIVALFGGFIPYQSGQDWLTSPLAVLFYGAYLPLSMVTNVIADAIAGERERHTLETLLASRLSDRSILVGKLCAAVGYTWGISIVTALVGMAVANLKHSHGGFQFYSAGIAVAIAVLAILVGLLYAGIGVLVSLRASTVRQAQQTLGVAFLVIFLLPVIGFQVLSPETRVQFLHWLSTANWIQVGILGGLVLLVIDLLLVAIAIARFQRSRLILS
jgi:ABC-2 type transport system permease protein